MHGFGGTGHFYSLMVKSRVLSLPQGGFGKAMDSLESEVRMKDLETSDTKGIHPGQCWVTDLGDGLKVHDALI